MTTSETSQFHRHTFPHIRTGSNRRSGYYLHLQEVDHSLKTSQAFQGTYINPGKEIDLPVGAIVIQRRPVGSAKFSTWTWSYTVIPAQGDPITWSPECDHDRFISFRDTVHAALQLAPRQDANGFRPDYALTPPESPASAQSAATALAMARYAFTIQPGRTSAPDERGPLDDASFPTWLVALAATATPDSHTAALTAALALVAESQTEEPAIRLASQNASARWDAPTHVLLVTAAAHGEATYQRSSKAARQVVPTALSITEFRAALASAVEQTA